MNLTTAALAPKRYIAWNAKTGMFFSNHGMGFDLEDKALAPNLSETELLLVRFCYDNVEWARV
jgi:hypothetical protein